MVTPEIENEIMPGGATKINAEWQNFDIWNENVN